MHTVFNNGGLGGVNVPVSKIRHYLTIFSTNHTERTASSRAEFLHAHTVSALRFADALPASA